ncbi:undecaprenyldiphospho-muramoylpentapeptide beta-N-acetylglucosaminyltransferase [Zooshikella harenae]|uniref:UDP-N-acetylglucosamine--N-acetylmuramyl-(pentapeptide) pyrophosphoryl-undecaprenol N-acetylglucosamine transferase n=1 Tax=Zooshikella harenae TaxID=2827238 RepID=A0ABS5Z847_9GAMM|nr:undecaprenyldiphospho-muramoylpentapeptide beta-N-acetylglucosaminyltransferase [Zooshikella harenae]MBU2710228.1 undecaprenyldiphospho-muramoylpentapeptide beta-N-acetylglucosaminyltransferase [Zooshikella harenae]
MSEQKTFVIMAGGTGGHIFPALATARQLLAQGHSVHWFGTPNSMEADLITKEEIPMTLIDVGGLRGKGIQRWVKAPLMVTKAICLAKSHLRSLKPHCVLGMGGYVAGPGGVAAKLLGIPLVIHEQNAIAGFTNRLLSRIATRVLEAFPGTFSSLHKVYCTGNPVRKNIVNLEEVHKKEGSEHPFRLLVLGGSLGAVAINEVMPSVIAELQQKMTIDIWHQTGKKNLTQTQALYKQHGVAGKIEAFIEDMGAAYQWADLVVCRAGALTIAEVANAGVPSILVPFPYAVDDHQTKNAHYLVNHGAAELVMQQAFTKDHVQFLLTQLMTNRERLTQMATAAYSLARPDATNEVVEHCLEVVKGG